MRRITSALFLDFDNIFGGLMKSDRAAAMALVADPGRLVGRLSALDEDRQIRRDVLIRRAYLNPNGVIPDPAPEGEDGSGPVSISRFRTPFTRAGFEVIDCPRFINTKNGADIRMVIDALDLLASPTRYDEVIVASSDSDFTPLLIRLRAHDRRTMIITTGKVAVPYGGAADRHIAEPELVALLSPPLAVASARISTTPTPMPNPTPASMPTPKGKALPNPTPTPKGKTKAKPTPKSKAQHDGRTKDERRACGRLDRMVGAAPDEGVSLSTIGNGIREEVGTEVVDASKWFGRKTLTIFINEVRPNLEVDTTRVRRRTKSAG